MSRHTLFEITAPSPEQVELLKRRAHELRGEALRQLVDAIRAYLRISRPERLGTQRQPAPDVACTAC